MSEFRFQDPFWLLLLIPLLAVGWWHRRREGGVAVLYSSLQRLRDVPVTWRQRFKQLLPWLNGLGMALVLFALARPQQGSEEFRVRAEGIAIEMCVDRSGSMLAMDFHVDGDQVDRLTAVKHVFERFVMGADGFDGRPDDQIGLVSFGGFADAVCPRTLDHGILIEKMSKLKVAEPIQDARGNVINDGIWQEEQATAIGDALALAVDRLAESEAKSKVIILLSDGENTAGVLTPEEAAAAAKEFGIKVYSIGVGQTGMAPFPATDFFGRQQLRAQQVRLDEKTLRSLAEITGGEYFNAKNTSSLQRVYEEIDRLEKTEIEGMIYTRYRELFSYPLLCGLACLLGDIVLRNSWLRSLP